MPYPPLYPPNHDSWLLSGNPLEDEDEPDEDATPLESDVPAEPSDKAA